MSPEVKGDQSETRLRMCALDALQIKYKNCMKGKAQKARGKMSQDGKGGSSANS